MNLMKLFRGFGNARVQSGVSYLHQLAQIISLAQSPNLVGPEEYFEFGLYDPKLPWAAKREFIGYKAERYYSQLNCESWHATANDKVLFEQIMRANNFLCPQTLGLFHPWRIASFNCKHIRDIDNLHDFLSGGVQFPLFVKPVHGLFGRGVAVISNYHSDRRTLVLFGGRELLLDEFFDWLQSNSREGMLFQTMLVPSDEVRPICGDRLSSVRMIVLCDDDGPSLFRANWKLSTGDNLVDNTDGWKNGNIVAAVDHVSGIVQAAYRGLNGSRIKVVEHPDTKTSLVGLEVPHWKAMKEYVELVARAFPRIKFQAWDVAATSHGICALELNLATFHTVYATQLVSQKGFLDSHLTKALREFL